MTTLPSDSAVDSPSGVALETSRRQFLKSAAAVTMGFGGLQSLFARNAFATPASEAIGLGFGPLVPDPNRIFDLPEGFRYQVISRIGQTMSDGLLVPGLPDAMGAFEGPNGKTIIVRNHELDPSKLDGSPYGPGQRLAGRLPRAKFYDAGFGSYQSFGGTTTIVFDTRTGTVEKEFMSLAGTIRNCAGGPTPWGSWITCEETAERASDRHGDSRVYEHDHGYNFEVPASATPGLAEPVPLRDMGRFMHEAVCVDPSTGIVYQTEDRHDGLIYRFVPNVPGKLREGGRLQALCVKGKLSLDTRNWEKQKVGVGERLQVEWMDMDDVQSPEDDLRKRGFARGAARFARGEGMWWGALADGSPASAYFACTSGGRINKGQVWRYTPSPAEGTKDEAKEPGVLELFIEPNDAGLIDNADNLTVAPFGDLVICEDGADEQFLVGVTPEGRIYKMGRNAWNNSELAGACFSPDGSTLFVNVQTVGITLAITGPWESRRPS
ncbi:MAG: alkaline phosphatase PhoX [Phycisphaerales bacterium JB064]